MRVAYCISGLMRTYEETFQSVMRNIIEPNQCDVFISTWDVCGNAPHNHTSTDNFQQRLNTDRLTELYGNCLKKIKVHEFNAVSPTLPKIFYGGMVSMYWQIRQCDQLRRDYEKEHGFNYDCVIRSRSDLMFHTGLQFSDKSQLGPSIWVPNFDEWIMDDCFAFGNRDAMRIYCDTFDSLEIYHRAKDFYKPHPKYNCVCWPEQTLLFHLQRCGLQLKSLPVKYTVHRGDYSYAQ